MRSTATIVILVSALLIAGAASSCGGKGGGSAAGTTPIADLIRAGKPPVVAGSMVRGLSPVGASFMMSLTNVCDCPISAVLGTAVFFDRDGRLLPESKSDLGYAELTTIKPGEKIELATTIRDGNAAAGKWIVKQVVYMKANPALKNLGEIPFKWTNANFDAELAAASAK